MIPLQSTPIMLTWEYVVGILLAVIATLWTSYTISQNARIKRCEESEAELSKALRQRAGVTARGAGDDPQ